MEVSTRRYYKARKHRVAVRVLLLIHRAWRATTVAPQMRGALPVCRHNVTGRYSAGTSTRVTRKRNIEVAVSC